jgi:Ca2+-binding RTX toxin-like protein
MSAWLRACATIIVCGLLLTLNVPSAKAQATCTGYIQGTNIDTSEDLGFVAPIFNAFGEYSGFTMDADPSSRLLVSFSNDQRFSITAINGPDSNVPFVGGIVGFANTSDDLGAGSYNYAYLGGTVETPIDSPPASGANSFTNATGIPEKIESAIWSLGASNELLPQWVNSDASKPATFIVFTQNTLALTGDPAVFVSTFGPAVHARFTFVSQGSPCAPDEPAEATCQGQAATVFVKDGKIVGGPDNGKAYAGKLMGTTGNDVIAGAEGDDYLDGRAGNDLICGSGGNDTLLGNDGDDTLDGGAGNDTLKGNDGVDILQGDSGDDNLNGGAGTDTLDGGADNDILAGGNNSDALTGGDGNDTLDGGGSADTLDGGAGNDALTGGDGNDTLTGGSDTDSFNGGNGSDTATDVAQGETQVSVP